MTFLRRLCKTLIAAFVVWHCIAIFLYSLISADAHPLLQTLYEYRKHVRPYVLITSQWQRWNLFSPDPLRRVIAIDIEAQTEGSWHSIERIDPYTVSVQRQANELKIIRRMEDEHESLLRFAYIIDVCRRHNLPLETPMRMNKHWYVIPKNTETQPAEWWDSWEPTWKSDILSEATCLRAV